MTDENKVQSVPIGKNFPISNTLPLEKPETTT